MILQNSVSTKHLKLNTQHVDLCSDKYVTLDLCSDKSLNLYDVVKEHGNMGFVYFTDENVGD